MRDFARIDLKRVLWRLKSVLAVVQDLSSKRDSSTMLGQSAIAIFKAKPDYIRNCKVAVPGNVSGVEELAEIRSGKFLSGQSTSKEIDAAIELQCEESCFGVLTFGSEGVGQGTFSW
jgi:hypothetical protein